MTLHLRRRRWLYRALLGHLSMLHDLGLGRRHRRWRPLFWCRKRTARMCSRSRTGRRDRLHRRLWGPGPRGELRLVVLL